MNTTDQNPTLVISHYRKETDDKPCTSNTHDIYEEDEIGWWCAQRVMGEGNRELVLANVAGEGASLNSQGEEKEPGMGTHRESVFQAQTRVRTQTRELQTSLSGERLHLQGS